jgi:hypothetical protein
VERSSSFPLCRRSRRETRTTKARKSRAGPPGTGHSPGSPPHLICRMRKSLVKRLLAGHWPPESGRPFPRCRTERWSAGRRIQLGPTFPRDIRVGLAQKNHHRGNHHWGHDVFSCMRKGYQDTAVIDADPRQPVCDIRRGDLGPLRSSVSSSSCLLARLTNSDAECPPAPPIDERQQECVLLVGVGKSSEILVDASTPDVEKRSPSSRKCLCRGIDLARRCHLHLPLGHVFCR